MSKQDPRVSKESLAYVEMFFQFVVGASRNDLESKTQLVELLDCLPDLVYAVNSRGNTALYEIVACATEIDLELARILVDRGAEPSAVNEENKGPYYALRLIHDTDIQIQMGEILGIDFQAAEDAHNAELRAREDAHFNNNHAHKTINKVNKGAKIQDNDGNKKPSGDEKCTIMTARFEESYEKSLAKIFANMESLNMDQKIELNRMSLEVHPLLRDISFHPMMYETASNNNNLPIIIIPKELVDIGYDKFVDIMGKLYNFCLGLNLDASEQ